MQPYKVSSPVIDWRSVGGVQGLDWVWEMLRLVLAPGLPAGGRLPTLLFYDQTEGLSATSWLAIENAIVVHDR